MKLIPKFPKRLVCWDGGTFRPIEYHSRPQTEGLYLGPQGPKQVVESVDIAAIPLRLLDDKRLIGSIFGLFKPKAGIALENGGR